MGHRPGLRKTVENNRGSDGIISLMTIAAIFVENPLLNGGNPISPAARSHPRTIHYRKLEP